MRNSSTLSYKLHFLKKIIPYACNVKFSNNQNSNTWRPLTNKRMLIILVHSEINPSEHRLCKLFNKVHFFLCPNSTHSPLRPRVTHLPSVHEPKYLRSGLHAEAVTGLTAHRDQIPRLVCLSYPFDAGRGQPLSWTGRRVEALIECKNPEQKLGKYFWVLWDQEVKIHDFDLHANFFADT